MERRSFLSMMAGASAAPLLGYAAVMGAETPTVKMVPSGEDLEGMKRAMGFSHLMFKVGAEQTQDGLFLIEQQFIKKGGPPRHMHPRQDEWFYVMAGEFVFEVGEPRAAKRITLKAGDSVLAPRGVPHVFAFVSDEPGRMLIGFTPAGKMEAFFRKVAIDGAPVPLTRAVIEEHDMVFLGPPLMV
jgi:quercetin dioxygenase-like cupin family protein